jgi:hypothetical protein
LDGGSLELASGYTLPNPAVGFTRWGLGELWMPQVQGENFDAAGSTWAVPRDIAQQNVSIPIVVVGDVDADGVAQADAVAGLFLNLQQLKQELMGPVVRPDASTSVPGYVFVTWTPYVGADPVEARWQVESIELGDRHPGWVTAVVRAVLPDGPLLPVAAP